MPATRQPELPLNVWRRLHKLLAAGQSFRRVAKTLGVALGTVGNYAGRVPPPAREVKPAMACPEPAARVYQAAQFDTPGPWLVLGDVHLPYHDRRSVELAVEWGRKIKAVGVLLNGDLLDSHELSDHDKDPRAARYVEEIEQGKAFLAWLRSRLPKAQIVYKAGNHEDRLERYIIRRAPAIWGLEGLDLKSLLHLAGVGAEYVGDKRVVRLGSLNVIHGHEYRGGVSTPVNPARGVYLKARSVVMCGHWHRTSEHHERDIRGRSEAAWSVGCLCSLVPQWLPLNNWNTGFAVVDVAKDGGFRVSNKRIMNGEVV